MAAKKPAKARDKPQRASAGKAPSKGQWVYIFGGGKAQGRSGMKDLLGGKGANLAEMANLGLPVPPGFTITTAVCTHYYANASRNIRRTWRSRSTPASPTSRASPGGVSATAPIRCSFRCAPAPAPRCRA